MWSRHFNKISFDRTFRKVQYDFNPSAYSAWTGNVRSPYTTTTFVPVLVLFAISCYVYILLIYCAAVMFFHSTYYSVKLLSSKGTNRREKKDKINLKNKNSFSCPPQTFHQYQSYVSSLSIESRPLICK